MKVIAIVLGWLLVIFGAAVGAVVVESLMYRRRVRREAKLHRRLGVGGEPLGRQ